MKAVKVEYIVQDGYIEQNKQNIQKVMNHLKQNPIDGMMYSSYTDKENPAKFIHINIARDEDAMSGLNDVQEFTDFRLALKASNPVSPPSQTKLDLVGAGFDI